MINAPVTLEQTVFQTDIEEVGKTFTVAVDGPAGRFNASLGPELQNTVAAAVQNQTLSTSIPIGESTVTSVNGQTGACVVGDMRTYVYDPLAVVADAFDAGNLHGNLDGGTFN